MHGRKLADLKQYVCDRDAIKLVDITLIYVHVGRARNMPASGDLAIQ